MNLLASLDKTTKSQVVLQNTVEGLSVIVIAYYVSGLANYLFKAMHELGWLPSYELASGLFVPIALGLSFAIITWGRNRIHKKLSATSKPSASHTPDCP